LGYTHYHHQHRTFTVAEWATICVDVAAILKDVEHVQGVALADGEGAAGTRPTINKSHILFNGIGDDAHEGFYLSRARPKKEDHQKPEQRGWSFTKTACKPYDLAVTAVLAYLSSVPVSDQPDQVNPLTVSTDGDGHDWLAGVALAQRVIARAANIIDIPLDIRKSDRWVYAPELSVPVSSMASAFSVDACVDGAVYVTNTSDERQSYRFPTKDEAVAYFDRIIEPSILVKSSWAKSPYGNQEGGKPILRASGSFDSNRTAKLAALFDQSCRDLIARAVKEARAIPPPAFVRPNSMPSTAKETGKGFMLA
jgi:hypothetical protein